MESNYRVYDDRNREESLFIGTHQEAMEFIHEHYIADVFEHIWMEEVK